MIDLVPDLIEDLLSSIDQPLQVSNDTSAGRKYLLCDYNRDGDSYRSPWSNEYFPRFPEGVKPSSKLRELEIQANEVFDVYRELYYEGGLSSVYCWDTDEGFASCILIKKVGDQDTRRPIQGVWDSIHVLEITESGKNAIYSLTSTVMLSMITNDEEAGSINLGGSMTRQSETELKITDYSSHVINMGKVVEDMEIKMRNSLEQVYFGKTFDIVSDLRKVGGVEDSRRRQNAQQNIMGSISGTN